jgi:hypothetical protein|tara:strand:+ start:150 stop:575 length:426 start_codon:yes stop_codon:yes gene_type:complete
LKDLSLHTDFDSLECEMLEVEQVHCPVKHHFGSGIYIREVFLPAGTLVLGHAHKEKHITIMLQGEMLVHNGGKVSRVKAPCTFLADVGRKAAFIIEDAIVQNVFATEETDLDVLEDMFVDKLDHSGSDIKFFESEFAEAIA